MHQYFFDSLPIIACSTGLTSNTAIAMIRISGFSSLSLFNKFFSKDLNQLKPRFSYLTYLRDTTSNSRLDQVLITYFPDHNSFTGENVLEISCHGNLLNVRNIIHCFISTGEFREALPGEFTYRALKNKKMTLSQVEGLDLLLNARSSLSLKQGMDLMSGELNERYLKLYHSFLHLKSSLELLIDFSEDIGEEEGRKLYLKALESFKSQFESLHKRANQNITGLLNPEIALVGETNAGKSSFFNSYIGHQRSIVSSVAGTTRDYVSEKVMIDGTEFSLIDTAGIRDAFDTIESIGIERSIEIINRAFVKVLVINPLKFDLADLQKIVHIQFDLIVFTHMDDPQFRKHLGQFPLEKFHFSHVLLGSFSSKNSHGNKSGSIGPNLNTGPIEPVESVKSGPIEPPLHSFYYLGPIGPKIESDSLGGPIEPDSEILKDIFNFPLIHGFENVLNSIASDKFKSAAGDSPLLLSRHREVVNKISLTMVQNEENLNNINDIAICDSSLMQIGAHISELIGVVSPDDILNSIFSNFCIGK